MDFLKERRGRILFGETLGLGGGVLEFSLVVNADDVAEELAIFVFDLAEVWGWELVIYGEFFGIGVDPIGWGGDPFGVDVGAGGADGFAVDLIVEKDMNDEVPDFDFGLGRGLDGDEESELFEGVGGFTFFDSDRAEFEVNISGRGDGGGGWCGGGFGACGVGDGACLGGFEFGLGGDEIGTGGHAEVINRPPLFGGAFWLIDEIEGGGEFGESEGIFFLHSEGFAKFDESASGVAAIAELFSLEDGFVEAGFGDGVGGFERCG